MLVLFRLMTLLAALPSAVAAMRLLLDSSVEAVVAPTIPAPRAMAPYVEAKAEVPVLTCALPSAKSAWDLTAPVTAAVVVKFPTIALGASVFVSMPLSPLVLVKVDDK